MPEFHKSVQEAVDSAKKYARELIAQERAEVINELAMNLLLSSACSGERMQWRADAGGTVLLPGERILRDGAC